MFYNYHDLILPFPSQNSHMQAHWLLHSSHFCKPWQGQVSSVYLIARDKLESCSHFGKVFLKHQWWRWEWSKWLPSGFTSAKAAGCNTPGKHWKERWQEEIDEQPGATTWTIQASWRPHFRVTDGWKVVTMGTQRQGARFSMSAPTTGTTASPSSLSRAQKELCSSKSTLFATGQPTLTALRPRISLSKRPRWKARNRTILWASRRPHFRVTGGWRVVTMGSRVVKSKSLWCGKK